jgi:dihydroorotate dehydrogenase (NAD+) catalytic subunit
VSVDLTTAVADLTLPTPVMVAAGCGGNGRELEPFGDLTGLGALVTRSVT